MTTPVPSAIDGPLGETGDTDDHARGCQGREYTCTCGYDDRLAASLAAEKQRAAELTAAVEQITMKYMGAQNAIAAADAQMRAMREAFEAFRRTNIGFLSGPALAGFARMDAALADQLGAQKDGGQ